jgi:MYXO-CTERM domain-containing protein
MALKSHTSFAAIAGICALGTFAFSGQCHAGLTPPALDFTLQINSNTPITIVPTNVGPNGQGQWHWWGSYGNENWTLQSDIIGGHSGSPFGGGGDMISAFMALQNLTANTNTYTITVNMAIDPIAIATFMDGSVGGSVTDSNGNGQAVAAAVSGGSMYIGLINAAGVASTALLEYPYSASVINSGGTESIGPASFGQPSPIFGPSGVNSIGIQLQVTLTPGDTVVMSSFFRVEPIPAPAGLALLGLAGLAGSRRRR